MLLIWIRTIRQWQCCWHDTRARAHTVDKAETILAYLTIARNQYIFVRPKVRGMLRARTKCWRNTAVSLCRHTHNSRQHSLNSFKIPERLVITSSIQWDDILYIYIYSSCKLKYLLPAALFGKCGRVSSASQWQPEAPVPEHPVPHKCPIWILKLAQGVKCTRVHGAMAHCKSHSVKANSSNPIISFAFNFNSLGLVGPSLVSPAGHFLIVGCAFYMCVCLCEMSSLRYTHIHDAHTNCDKRAYPALQRDGGLISTAHT